MEKAGEATQFMSSHRGERALTPPNPPGSGVSRKTYFSDSVSGGARPAGGEGLLCPNLPGSPFPGGSTHRVPS